MQNKKFAHFKTVYIEEQFKNHKNTLKILSHLSVEKIFYINDVKQITKELSLENAKESLFLGGIRGEILQRCPGSHGHICCNYYVINLYIGCPLGCQYCILQSYLNQPFIMISVDLENIFANVERILANNKNKIFRIGTGELSDSLVFDLITDYSIDFVNFFSNKENAIFEFKTKTNFIDNLLNIKGDRNIVVGFSVNPEKIIREIEGESNSLLERLEASRLLKQNGYKIAIHFDPIVKIENFEFLYEECIEMIFRYITPTDIAWLSLGTLRFTKDLKNQIEFNYPFTSLLSNEFLENVDKKYRYFKAIRVELYKKILNMISKYDKNNLIPIYLCMESPWIWQETLKKAPDMDERLKFIFSR